MKPSVLLATEDAVLRDQIKAGVSDVCHLQSVITDTLTLPALEKRDYQALVVDSRSAAFSEMTLLHTLHHLGKPEMVLVSAGFLTPATTFTAQEIGHRVVSLPRSAARVKSVLRALFDPASAKTLREVTHQSVEDVFFVAFSNGKVYELPRKAIEGDHTSPVVRCRVLRHGDAFEVRERDGTTYTVPWDFVLYHQEPRYAYYKGRPEQREREAASARRIGERVRRAREERHWSQADLAERTGLHAPNLSRLESGAHVPSLPTLERVAEALGLRVVDLVAA